VLTEDDKNHIRAIWGHVDNNPEAFGVEALTRLFLAYPATKTYFAHFDLNPGSAQIKAHGKKVVDALTQAVNNLDDIPDALAKLADLHAEKLRVDPVNFGLLGHCILVTIAAHNHGPLKADVALSMDKFLTKVAKTLVAHYR
uniref:Hemoglobin subunit alpha-1 n=1 Tax=Iguana iguana TaxID=8517 RepID=HBA1_IGUIG|nr:RecName: Full=Hemoglobin subunit alpha-1; AltName: Full=Alpha-1-globin; AltName: Full=Hemoglobin alpha-1 chain [Iguana iguana]